MNKVTVMVDKSERPVPRFLFLDQPYQVYFPSELDEKEIDWNEVNKMYQFIIERTKEAKVGHYYGSSDTHRKLGHKCENCLYDHGNLLGDFVIAI